MGSPNPQGDRERILKQVLNVAQQGSFLDTDVYSTLSGIQAGTQSGALNTGATPQPRYRARTRTADAICQRLTKSIVEALPPTAAVRIEHVTLIIGDGATPEVEVTFWGRGSNTLTLPLTAEFPTDADISRILLAMP